MKRILGLDLGTNSIGWAFVHSNFEKKAGSIEGIGSRIIPMDQGILGKFDAGISISQTAERTNYRGTRRLYQRDNLRRDRLHRVLNILKYLPKHYASSIDFEKHLGQFKKGTEPKLNYFTNKLDKHEFLFKDSFEEMISEFKANDQGTKIPYDWTIYYLRKKALSKPITKEELAWILLNFNQKRGYYQLRGEEEDISKDKVEEFYALKVSDVLATEDINAKGTWYNIILENGWIYRRQSKESLFEWKGKTKEFITTITLDKDGTVKTDKEGNENRSFRAVDSEKDWIAIKKKTENDILNSRKTVGQYIYESLLQNPTQKIRGRLVKTIERKFYREELNAILEKQISFHEDLQDRDLYKKCIEELYPRNEAHQKNIAQRDFKYLFIEDITFYQRPLKSKKSSIADCPYESRFYKNENSEFVKQPLKAISKSNPIFQEFRLWQFLHNLKIYKLDEVEDIDVTSKFISKDDDWIALFDFLNDRREIDQKAFLKNFKLSEKTHRWNYVIEKKYPCNDTRGQIKSKLSKLENVDIDKILTNEFIKSLWHIIYSVTDKNEFETALGTFATKNDLDKQSFVENFKKFPPFESSYGAYSEKAIKKMLTVMRMGNYWEENSVDEKLKSRITSILERLETINFDINKLDLIQDDDIPQRLLKSFAKAKANPLSGLNTYQACYAIYNRHSEVGSIKQWKRPKDITTYLDNFKQHSLRNPIVEQVMLETLRVVRDIWEYYGTYTEIDGKKIYDALFDEIHLELGREMKNDKKTRERISKSINEKENTNERIKSLLQEIKNDSTVNDDVRPFSPSHQEILKLYEEGVYDNPNVNYNEVSFDEIEKIRRNTSPTRSELTRYKLWLEQGYISPYTGKTIPLSKLFSTAYQIEHIIPQSRYFDNSMSNKVICESVVNEEKGNETAYAFLKKRGGELIELGQGKTVTLLSLENFENHCRHYFRKNKSKLTKLLSEEIPEGFINRQLNDSRYISKLIKGLLSNIVREDGEKEATSKNLVPINGAITSKLKKDWGLNDKWNELIAPRFMRLNELSQSQDFGYWDKKINAFRTQVPDELSKGFSKKRIDHRHHALDALVIACTTKDHINYITSLNTERKNHSLVSKLRTVEKKQIRDTKNGNIKTISVAKTYHQPWSGFTTDAKEALETTVVSFKQNLRIINKTNNKTQQWVKKTDKFKKEFVKQTKGQNWAIRKPLHRETVSGKVLIKKEKGFVSINLAIDTWEMIIDKTIKEIISKTVKDFQEDLVKTKKHFKSNPIEQDGKIVSKIAIYENVEATATRVPLSEKFTRKQLESTTDSGIQRILENHLKNYIDEKGKERFDLAFNSDGIDEMNKNIQLLNEGKKHQPIKKVRIYEVGNKFSVGEEGAKSKKYVEAAKGTNLFFAIYWDDKKQKRNYETIPLEKVIAWQKEEASLPKQQRTGVPINNLKGQFLFSLSPNDMVYVPNEEEKNNPLLIDFKNLTPTQINNIYKMDKASGKECYFTRFDIASLISPYSPKSKFGELGSQNKLQTTMCENNFKIVDRCIKLEIDKLGTIKKVIK
ncbi:type II CRISPR RNA-guided endonuclease Cas9 [uncultured Dokdonia sp.]|uniref:type II CRISPR RNA-guided endonuclease Cas9 n=1 Tax=uncultured Dokdonia sp. TaxID=575653 RepID=UPI0026336D4D|nr:type II CRISPR RNA-guided endonuclease Cas9 [uncultured Dokdonia sp.]